MGAAGDAKCRPALWVRSGTYALGQLAAWGAVASGSCGVPRPRLADYVTEREATDGTPEVDRVVRSSADGLSATGELPVTPFSRSQGRWRHLRVFSAPRCSALEGVQAGYRLITQGRWFKSRARNHLQANRSLGFCFEIPV